MLRLIGILFLTSFLTGCLNSDNKSSDSYARCKEIKRQLLFQYATNDERVATERAGEIDNLNRSYRDNDCN